MLQICDIALFFYLLHLSIFDRNCGYAKYNALAFTLFNSLFVLGTFLAI